MTGKFGNIRSWWAKRTKQDKVILIAIIALGVGVLVYTNSRDEKLELPLSEAVILSQSVVFNEMIVYLRDSSTTLELIVGEGYSNTTFDIDNNPIILLGGEKVTVEVGTLNIKELEEMGFVLPSIYSTEARSSTSMWSQLFPMFVMIGGIGLIYWLYANGHLSGGGRFKRTKNNIKLSDIGGITEIKENITDVIGFLKGRSYYDRVGAVIPKGILLVGEPGTGKTMLAKAIATEADVPFYFVSGSEFHSMWVGLAGMKVKGLFKKASRTTSIVFIDEFDSIAHKRASGTGDAGREWNHTLNQLLSEMDGFKVNSKVLVLAATNRVDILDTAVLRPGRFDRKITVPLPNFKDRCEILTIHSQGKPLSSDVRLEEIARQTTGFSGADLALLINEAAIRSAKEHGNLINMSHLTMAIDKVLVGDERKSFTITKEERKTIAYHEAGHTIVASYIPDGDAVERVSILPHSHSGGFTRTGQDIESILLTKSKAMNTIAILLGGRVADEIMGDVTSGAQDDIRKANDIAMQMVEQYGMGESYGLRCSTPNSLGIHNVDSKLIEGDITWILKQCHEIAKSIIDEHSNVLHKIADRLLQSETLDGDEIKLLIKEEEY